MHLGCHISNLSWLSAQSDEVWKAVILPYTKIKSFETNSVLSVLWEYKEKKRKDIQGSPEKKKPFRGFSGLPYEDSTPRTFITFYAGS